MGLDAILKRYFAAIVCVLIGAAAYFQASGMGTLVASSVALDPSSTALIPPPLPPRPPATAAPTDHSTSAALILSRNPFDSVTGPLDPNAGSQLALPTAEGAKVEANENPYDDADCDVARALMIVASEDPHWSFAALAGSDGKTILRRQGDEIGGYTVEFIGDYRTIDQREGAKPDFYDRVWLKSSTGARCQIRLGGKAPVKAAPPKEPAVKKGGSAPKEITDKIHKISDTEFNVDRSAVSAIIENQAELMKARILPEKEGDKVVGFRLYGVKPDSLLGALGIENGDRIGSINGFEMSNPSSALEAYTKLQTADQLNVSVTRHNKPINIVFNIK